MNAELKYYAVAAFRHHRAMSRRRAIRNVAIAFAGLTWTAVAGVLLVAYPTAFALVFFAVALYVAHRRAEDRRAVRNATVQQLAFARIVREGGARR